jgi:hypothetical protein
LTSPKENSSHLRLAKTQEHVRSAADLRTYHLLLMICLQLCSYYHPINRTFEGIRHRDMEEEA